MAVIRKSTVGLLVLDTVAVLVCFNLALYLRALINAPVLLPLLWPLAASVIAIYLVDGYKARTDMMSLDYTSQHAIGLLTALIFILLLTFVFVPAGYELQSSRSVILISFIVLIPVTLSYRRVAFAKLLQARGVRSIIFVGDPVSCQAFQLECNAIGMQQPVVHTVALKEASSSAPPLTSTIDIKIQPLEAVLQEIETGNMAVDSIVLRESSRDLPDDISRRLMLLYFQGVPTYTLELFHQVYWRKIPIYRLNHTWLFQEGFPIAREPVFERVKRLSDIMLSSLGLILAVPLILPCAMLIWLEDRGPVFFRQNRIGRNRVPFRIIKLRTMRQGGTGGDKYTQPGDKRITRIGSLLRLTRLDELPQLWNVLIGEMSLIGPRAEWDVLVDQYEAEIHCYHFRHLVKPGITGWAQVNYPYGANLEDTIRKLEYDLYYIRHFSFLLDAAIVLKTIHIMLFGKGR
ncbi:MAG: exopolysaccharide biosynthesis polyprenyl glycosylphosphotransferase [Cephaloticoccus sp.]|nr:exopolysaccharide biosynthesis polyprenyl glycosylphosphotransferase [Cephaloticoccus sp.]MCF7759435.1 exopolysaccharide biosynthesis polyprenyl glycosylphosphotransferase [Cephaloticoccus sp.]